VSGTRQRGMAGRTERISLDRADRERAPHGQASRSQYRGYPQPFARLAGHPRARKAFPRKTTRLTQCNRRGIHPAPHDMEHYFASIFTKQLHNTPPLPLRPRTGCGNLHFYKSRIQVRFTTYGTGALLASGTYGEGYRTYRRDR
jgi:hypothetical protein